MSKTLHAKRSLAKNAYGHRVDSPAYDASEEDNDYPLTDDSVSGQQRSGRNNFVPASGSTSKHQQQQQSQHHQPTTPRSRAYIPLSDSDQYRSGIDSPTYDGDVESSATTTGLGLRVFGATPIHDSNSINTLDNHTHHTRMGVTSSSSQRKVSPPSSASPLTSNGNSPRILPYALTEPAVADISASTFNPASLTPEDIQAFVRKAIDDGPDGEVDLGFDEKDLTKEIGKPREKRGYQINEPPADRPIRVYADGVYDLFHFGHALQLRQAKLSFSNVYLLVGVNSDEQVHTHKAMTVMTHAERLEAVRHCRWVDEIVPTAPWVITQEFLDEHQIDYVAHDEEAYPSAGVEDVYGYVKSVGKFFPTRRTPGVSTSDLLGRIVSGYRNRNFDAKLVKIGREELKAEGSEYDGISRQGSRIGSRIGSRRGSISEGTAAGVSVVVIGADENENEQDKKEESK
ncbi:hypothetical protein FA15DRAFT_669079 [Coprinopsis marcescibilis]|uniref:choline-phosphate cytidylyltransferase n=1 Tax=Coprinopsis marcescibilis TaxID=230819 RepID=A0A5C3KW50_COPMA|nr:hypothetical protein FA15DRAFT_669079 [Coprinopsis marcescibilis]